MKSLPQQNKLQQNKKYKPKVFTNHKNAKKVNTHTHTHTHTHTYIYEKVVNCSITPKQAGHPKKKKKKKKRKRKQVIKLCCRSVISIFFKLWRILASNCSSLSRLRRLVCLNLFVNSFKVQILQVCPWTMFHQVPS